jgi:hypothetical protein
MYLQMGTPVVAFTMYLHVLCMASSVLVEAEFDPVNDMDETAALLQISVTRDMVEPEEVLEATPSKGDPGVPNKNPGDMPHPYNGHHGTTGFQKDYGSTKPEIKSKVSDSVWYHDIYPNYGRDNSLFDLSMTNPQAAEWPNDPTGYAKKEAEENRLAEEPHIRMATAEKDEAEKFYKEDYPYMNGEGTPEQELDEFTRYRKLFPNENAPLVLQAKTGDSTQAEVAQEVAAVAGIAKEAVNAEKGAVALAKEAEDAATAQAKKVGSDAKEGKETSEAKTSEAKEGKEKSEVKSEVKSEAKTSEAKKGEETTEVKTEEKIEVKS